MSVSVAGSVVALLIWVNYSAQIFFLGAAFTRVFAEMHGRGAEPEEGTPMTRTMLPAVSRIRTRPGSGLPLSGPPGARPRDARPLIVRLRLGRPFSLVEAQRGSVLTRFPEASPRG